MLAPAVVAPSCRDPDRGGVGPNQKAQSHRRRKEAPLGALTVLRGFLGQAGALGNLAVEVVVLVVGRLLGGGRPGRHQEAGEVPHRRALPAGQGLLGVFALGAGTDEVEVEGVDEGGADLQRCFRFGDVRGLAHAIRAG